MMSARHILPACAVVAAALLAGCRTPQTADSGPTAAAFASIDSALARTIAGASVENRPVECLVLGEGDDVTLFLATIHGNETAGTPLLWRLADHLLCRPHLLEGRTVVILPEANPDGVARKSRRNANGVDINRNFPAANRVDRKWSGPAPLSEPEAAVIHDLIRRHAPRCIVTIHQPLACIDYDGPGEALAARMAGLCGLPVRKLGALPGSLGSFAGVTLGIPTITVELPRKASSRAADELWDRYGAALVAAILLPDGTGPEETPRP